MEARVKLTDVPSRLELQCVVTIGTKFTVRVTPFDDESPLACQFFTNEGECALEIRLLRPPKQGRRARVRLASINAAAESIPISKKISTLAAGKEFLLSVLVKEHVFEISLNTKCIGSFIHRVHPSAISTMLLDGSAICRELVVMPVLPPLPAYREIVSELQAPQTARRPQNTSGGTSLFRKLFYLRHSRFSRMLKRRQTGRAIAPPAVSE